MKTGFVQDVIIVAVVGVEAPRLDYLGTDTGSRLLCCNLQLPLVRVVAIPPWRGCELSRPTTRPFLPYTSTPRVPVMLTFDNSAKQTASQQTQALPHPCISPDLRLHRFGSRYLNQASWRLAAE
jgi:hypothetical protein